MADDDGGGLMQKDFAVARIRLEAQVLTLRFAVAAVISVLSEGQRSEVSELLTQATKATDLCNAEMSAFSVGEEMTSQMGAE